MSTRAKIYSISAIALAVFLGGVGVYLALDLGSDVSSTRDRVVKIERVEDPCVKDIHSDICQNRTCIRDQDVGNPLSPECRERLRGVRASGRGFVLTGDAASDRDSDSDSGGSGGGSQDGGGGGRDGGGQDGGGADGSGGDQGGGDDGAGGDQGGGTGNPGQGLLPNVVKGVCDTAGGLGGNAITKNPQLPLC
jgi:hypothetical protein